MTLSLEYLQKKLRLCWSAEQLAEAAKLWPADANWAWFLGDRLEAMPRRDAMDRVNVAISHLGAQRYRAPKRPGEILAYFHRCSDAELVTTAAAFGAWLDAPKSAELADHFAALMRGETPGIIEAAPPPAEVRSAPVESNEREQVIINSSDVGDAAAVLGLTTPQHE